MLIKTLLISAILAYFAVVANARKDCSERKVSGADSVCVCNATYCDDFPPFNKPSPGSVLVFESGKSGLRFKESTIPFSKEAQNTSAKRKQRITITAETFQKILGFGGAFTDSAGLMIKQLPEAMQKTLINDYFSENGIEYSMGRIPIGGSDYSTRAYSYDDVPGDLKLDSWALQKEDTDWKIPYIKMAQSVAKYKDLKLFGSPWSPPAWMKDNNKFNESGKLRGEVGGEYYNAWAQHFVKFLDSYKKDGIKMWGLTVENEPIEGQNPKYTFNCLYLNQSMERDFVKLSLGPILNQSGYGPDQIALMIFDENTATMESWADIILGDKDAAKYIKGIAFHWYGNSKTGEMPATILENVHKNHKDYFLLSTEACPLDGAGHGKWINAEYYARDIIRDLNHWVTGWIDWNIAVDMNGGPRWNEKRGFGSPILIDPTAKEYYKEPLFYTMGHFSKFIPPESVRVGTKLSPANDTSLWITAFKTPDNAFAVVVLNQHTEEVELTIEQNSSYLVHNISASSLQSYIWW